jgi:hypothetical protein
MGLTALLPLLRKASCGFLSPLKLHHTLPGLHPRTLKARKPLHHQERQIKGKSCVIHYTMLYDQLGLHEVKSCNFGYLLMKNGKEAVRGHSGTVSCCILVANVWDYVSVGLWQLTGPLSSPEMVWEWIWSRGGMSLTWENWQNYRKPCPSANLSTINRT